MQQGYPQRRKVQLEAMTAIIQVPLPKGTISIIPRNTTAAQQATLRLLQKSSPVVACGNQCVSIALQNSSTRSGIWSGGHTRQDPNAAGASPFVRKLPASGSTPSPISQRCQRISISKVNVSSLHAVSAYSSVCLNWSDICALWFCCTSHQESQGKKPVSVSR